MVIDWLAAGVNPGSSTMFIQSKVPEHAELHLLLSMITPLGWLERVPTYKDQQEKRHAGPSGTAPARLAGCETLSLLAGNRSSGQINSHRLKQRLS